MKDSMKPMIKVAIVWIRFSDMCPKVGQKMSEKTLCYLMVRTTHVLRKKTIIELNFQSISLKFR